jgi:hypothetical protein
MSQAWFIVGAISCADGNKRPQSKLKYEAEQGEALEVGKLCFADSFMTAAIVVTLVTAANVGPRLRDLSSMVRELAVSPMVNIFGADQERSSNPGLRGAAQDGRNITLQVCQLPRPSTSDKQRRDQEHVLFQVGAVQRLQTLLQPSWFFSQLLPSTAGDPPMSDRVVLWYALLSFSAS